MIHTVAQGVLGRNWFFSSPDYPAYLSVYACLCASNQAYIQCVRRLAYYLAKLLV